MSAPFQPLCMTADELELWEEANDAAAKPASGPCHDCPVAWRERMNAVGLCNRPAGIASRGGKHGPERRETWARAARQYRARKAAAA